VDPLLLSNVPLPNRNVTILEWLENRPEFSGRVAASTSWDVFSGILHAGRNKFPHWFSGGPPKVTMTPRMQEIERWMRDLPKKSRDEHFDAFAFHAAMDFLDTIQPRMLYLALGEADTNGHARRYDKYLDSITRSDRFLRELWEKLQSMPQYRGTTTLIVTTDHGRGATPDDWKHHRNTYPHSNETWLAAIGPDTPALGERRAVPLIKQTQIAATVAQLLGVDYQASVPAAGKPIVEIFSASGAQ
jgi:arylsulfatase A-like enzyme